MLKVETEVKDSTIPKAGKGLFATRDIKKGEIVWEYDPIVDKKLSREEYAKLSVNRQKLIAFWGFHNERTGNWIICGDESRRVNHSDNPNIGSLYNENDPNDEGVSVAIRDIKAGEEITDDYSDYDLAGELKLGGTLPVPKSEKKDKIKMCKK